ncbi:MAG: MmcQ-like protein [Bacillales bacterium]|jgi:predicted DNA-binding protein (MmcQ/YjbR family)|nr:MmcQ-like protein [Bacillales bacterium]
MNKKDAYDYALSKKAAVYEFKEEWACSIVRVGGKMFLLEGGEEKINLKCDPLLAVELREQFDGIAPGYHMSKAHWNTISLQSDVSDDEIKQMIDHSYELIVNSLTKKLKTELELM